ncbi:MAG: kinase-like domain-containing protein [Piptocephalis tieghemiana]|nr:MAG: kinase-like domain-containing protein [Piptocephalis tieghemiana]
MGSSQLLQRLRRDERLERLLPAMQALNEAYMELARAPGPRNPRMGMKLQMGTTGGGKTLLRLGAQGKLEGVAVPTLALKPDPTGAYEGICGVRGFEEVYTLVGGLNAPKRIVCLGTGGQVCIQLVKAGDDLRQDAVMQQVFEAANTLLRQTGGRGVGGGGNGNGNGEVIRARMRTYRVIPLSGMTGVIEWIGGTQPLGDILTLAHRRYRPGDWDAMKCRKHLAMAHARTGIQGVEGCRQAFREIQEHFQPVFGRWMLDRAGGAQEWVGARRQYVSSVATSSILGMILGLGDRHVQNILLDVSTAEVVHIDLGVAFENGLLLQTPERVPFRLTGDMVDGMGKGGGGGKGKVSGAFRREAQVALGAFRRGKSVLMAILDVLCHDPLYQW